MKNYRKHIDDFFREKLGKYSEVPPADVWESLDTRLDTLKPTLPGSPHRWLWHAGIVSSLIVVLSVSLSHKFTSDKSNNSITSNAPIAQISPLAPNSLTTSPSASEAKAVDVNAPAIADNAASTPSDANNAQSAAANNAQTAANTANAVAANSGTGDRSGKKPVSVTAKHVNSLKNQTVTYAATGSNTSAAAKTQPANVYNSAGATTTGTVTENTPAQTPGSSASANIFDASANVAANTTAKPAQTIPGTFKQNNTGNDKKTTKPADKKHTLPADFTRWAIGIKAGYEGGLENGAASKFVVSPYVQYNISPKFAVMIQPAVKYAQTKTTNIGTDQSYTKVNEDGKITQDGPSTLHTSAIGGGFDSTYWTRYTITQTHDSIVKSNTVGGSYMEYELPVLLKYNITKTTSVYGGVNIIYTQTKGVTEHTYTKQGILNSMDTTIITTTIPTSSPAVSNVFTYNGTPYANYNGPLYPTTQESQIRFGAMLGVSYEYSKRWLFDALIQQNPAKTDMRGGYNINVPLSSTYFRLSVGYKLTK